MDDPDLSPAPGWRVLPSSGAPNRSFVSGDPDGQRLRVRYYVDDDAGEGVARAWFGPLAEGPPGHAHGGSIAAVLDEAMGQWAWTTGRQVVAGTLTVRYRRPLPLGTVTTVRSRVGEEQGRRVPVSATLVDDDGVLYAEGSCVYVRLGPEIRAVFTEALASGTYRPPDAY